MKKTGSVRNILIPISGETCKRIDRSRLTQILEELFLLILLEGVSVQLKEVDDMTRRVTKPVTFAKKDAIILFSGGVDSYSGIKVAEREYASLLGVFVAHNDQARIIHIVEQMTPLLNTKIRTVYAPGMGSYGYLQLRGFVYILSAGVYAHLCKADRILVTECGPTMYQPMFWPYDSITYTTHPYVLKAANDVLAILLDIKPKIVIPFEDLTKAEVISNSGIKDFSLTHSCISQRFGDHDGTCFGCVIRRLACLVSGVKDVTYNKDVFAKGANQDNLLNALAFSSDLLDDYESMPAFQTEKIEEFQKHDLFRRYALDNLAGLMIGVQDDAPLYRKFIVDKRVLQERISEVRASPKKPDFSKCVN